MLVRTRRSIARNYAEIMLLSALFAGACAGTRTGVVPATASKEPSIGTTESCAAESVPTSEARSLVDKYCVSCHSPTGAAGEDYDFRGDTALAASRRGIEAKLRLRVMPPPKAPQPSDDERATLRCWAKQ